MKRLFDQLEEALAAVLVVVLCLVVGAEVVLRYVLTNPLSWTEEFSTIVFAYVTMLGSSIALKRGEHFAVELFRPYLGAAAARAMRTIVLAVVAGISVYLVYYGSIFAMRNHIVTTPAMHWPRSIPYAAIPFGGALMLARSLQLLVRLRQGGEVKP